MFIGIVEVVGMFVVIILKGEDISVMVNVGNFDMVDVKLGDSIVINGVCLMVVDFGFYYYSVDLFFEIFNKIGFIVY